MAPQSNDEIQYAAKAAEKSSRDRLVSRSPASLFARDPGLWIVFALQAVCASFFLADALGDMTGSATLMGFAESDFLESIITVVLGVSLVFTGCQLYDVLTRQKRLEQQMQIASGAFAELLEAHFDAWALTPSERDVALMAIKGLSIADMARLRETKDGTIKAQCNAVYRKAGVSGRPQLLSVFIEDLMADGLNTSPTGLASAN